MPTLDSEPENTTNLEVEKAVLAAVMALDGTDSSRAWGVVLQEIGTPLAFSERDHVFVATAANELWMLGKPCDAMSVATALTQVRFHDACSALSEARTGRKMRFELSDGITFNDSVLYSIGGYNAVLELRSFFFGANSLEKIKVNASVVAEHYRQRLAIQRLNRAIRDLKSPTGRIQMRKVVEESLEDLIRLLGSRSGTKTMDEAIVKVVEHHQTMKQQATKPVPRWPLAKLEAFCQMRMGALVTLAGTNGGGKTSLALQTATATADHLNEDGCVGIVSREMVAEDLTRIIACREAGIDSGRADRGELTASELLQVEDAAKKYGKRITMIDTMETMTHKEVCSWARQQHLKTNGAMKLLIVDHIGCLDPVSPRHTEYERITAATRAFKVLANDLRIVVLCLCQINRNGQRKSEMGGTRGHAAQYGIEDFSLADLKGSGSIGDDSDAVVFICRQVDSGAPDLRVKVKVGKNRWGGKHNDGGGIEAVFRRGDGQRFDDGTKAAAGDPESITDHYLGKDSVAIIRDEAKNTREARLLAEPQEGEDLFG